jgi:hypothetical protein
MSVWACGVHGEALVGWVGRWSRPRGSRVVSSLRRNREREVRRAAARFFFIDV